VSGAVVQQSCAQLTLAQALDARIRQIRRVSPCPEAGTRGNVAGVLEIITESVDTAITVTVTGEVDHLGAAQLRTAVTAALAGAGAHDVPGVIVIDLTGVSFLDSAGLSALVDATGDAGERGNPLRIVVGQQGPVIRTIQLRGLNSYLTLCNSVADALAIHHRG